jgi:RNA recognition motif-containing protein
MNIYAGNLAFSTSEADLRTLFEKHGEVSSANLITDRMSGQSKGFAFIEMPQKDQAQAAITALNGTEVNGRAITVNEARPKSDKPRHKSW